MENDSFPIRINCICNKKYDAPRWPKAKCPSCGHVWNMHPLDMKFCKVEPKIGIAIGQEGKQSTEGNR
jgi:hypothetical protein